jgi:hypothetical protein
MIEATPEQWQEMMLTLKQLIYSRGGQAPKRELFEMTDNPHLAKAVVQLEPDVFFLGEKHVRLAWINKFTAATPHVDPAAPKKPKVYKATLARVEKFKALVAQCQKEQRYMSESKLCEAIGASRNWVQVNVWRSKGNDGRDSTPYEWALELRELADTLTPYCPPDQQGYLKLSRKLRERAA